VNGVLVLGGYGAFGTRVCQLLARAPELAIHVAGRRLGAAEAATRRLGVASAQAVALDRDRPDDVAAFLRAHRPRVMIDAVGPFQGRDYRLPELAAAHGVHAIDLADDRTYVTGITALDARARARGVLITSGASTAPALTMAVVDRLLENLDALESIDVGISPGHRSPRGRSTIRSILSYCGKPIPAVERAHRAARRGWGDLTRHRYPPPVGGRWLSNVDLPEIALLPQRFPGVESIALRAGLELSVLHLGLSFLSALVAHGMISSLVPASRVLQGVAASLHPFGSDAGAMHVTVRGIRAGQRFARHWAIVAEDDHGPYIPAAPASVLAKRLCGVSGYSPLATRGALPCVGLVTLEEFLHELSGFTIRTVMRDEVLPA
jgi:saccharopine dehydrogenase-like NADP-dependent oxidoreductase